MSDVLDSHPVPVTGEDKTLPVVAYVLYLLGHATLLPVFIALVIAYANRGRAGPVGANHYTFLIRTFWISIGWYIIGGLLIAVGVPLTLVLIGIPIVGLGGTIMAAVWLWAVVRCVLGLIHLTRDEPYPRPMTWLI